MGEVCADVIEESRFLSFHGVRVHFRVCPCENAPRHRVLMLASPLINAFHWRKLVPELIQSECLVVPVDLPGFGRSDCRINAPQDHATRANIIWGILDEIDRQTGAPDAMWHLMAHGSACATILQMAGMYPDSVKSQVHIAPLMTVPNPLDGMDFDEWYSAAIADRDGFRSRIEGCAGYPLDDYILDRMRAPLLRQGAAQNLMNMLRAGRHVPDSDVGFCPAMAIIGGRDPLMTDEAMEKTDRFIGGAETHTLQSAGHLPMETHSKALRDYLRGWIRFNE